MILEKYNTLKDLLFDEVYIPKGTEVLVGEFDKGYVSEVSLCNNVLAHTPIYYTDGKPLTKVHGRIGNHKELFIKHEYRKLANVDEALAVMKDTMKTDPEYYNYWVDSLTSHFSWNWNANGDDSRIDCEYNANFFVGNLFGITSYSIMFSLNNNSYDDIRNIFSKEENKEYFNPFSHFQTNIQSRMFSTERGLDTLRIDLLHEFINENNIIHHENYYTDEATVNNMLQNLVSIENSGGCIFIGELDEEMKENLRLAEEKGLEIIHLT